MLPAGHRPATSWMHYTTSCNTLSSAPEDGQNNCPKHVALPVIINKPLLLHLVGCLYYFYQWCTVKKISDNEIYLLIKYIKSFLWGVTKRLSYIEDARCLKFKHKANIYCLYKRRNRSVRENWWVVESCWNVKVHGDSRAGKWRGNGWVEFVASTLRTTSEHGLSNITTADAHTLAASSRLNWRAPADLNGLVRFAERRNLVPARVPSHFKRSLILRCRP